MDPMLFPKKATRAPAPAADGPDLFSQPPEPSAPSSNPAWLVAPLSPIEHEFQRFHAQNPAVYAALERMALAAAARGEQRTSIAKLVEDIRYELRLQTEKTDAFLINNSFRALYARLLIHRHPALGALLETRQRREAGKSA